MGGIRNTNRRHRSGERGAIIVEAAIVFPVLALLLFGMISGGLALDDKQQMTHATREGARYAAVVPRTQTFATGTWASNVRDLIVERSDGALSAADVCVSLVEGSPGAVVSPATTYSTTGSPCIPGQTFPVATGDPGRRIQVTARRSAEIQLLVQTLDITLATSATARSESTT